MEKSEALRIIRALADGVHPVTGEVFPKYGPYQDPQIVRALFAAAEALEQTDKKPRPDMPGNAGRPWSELEDKALCQDFDAGMTIQQLTQKHQRTKGAIRSRLEKKGKWEALKGLKSRS